MSYKLLMPGIIAGLLVGCGAGEISSPLPATLTFESSNLDDFDNEVPSGIPQIIIKVAEQLDPASVNEQTVHLMVGNSESHLHGAADPDITIPTIDPEPIIGGDVTGVNDAITGRVWYEESTKSIYFEPKQTLSDSTTYHLRIHDVKLIDGRKVNVEPTADDPDNGVIQFNFTTTHSHEILRTRYNREGTITSYVTFNVVDNIAIERKHYNGKKELKFVLQYQTTLPGGRLATLLYKNGAGEITQYYFEVIENGTKIANVRIKEAGADLIWGNDDDIVASWSQPQQQHLTHSITNNYKLKNLSDKITWTGINDPAFELKSIYLSEHAGVNFQHRNIFYKSLGIDGELDVDPVTGELSAENDQISLWHKGDFANGLRIRSWSLRGTADSSKSGKGIDGRLFTGDDIATGLTTLNYHPQNTGLPVAGFLDSIATYYNSTFARPQDEWFLDKINNIVVPEATLHSYTLYNYDNFGTRTETVRFFPGDDGIMASRTELLNGTADDYVVQRRTFNTSATINGDSLL